MSYLCLTTIRPSLHITDRLLLFPTALASVQSRFSHSETSKHTHMPHNLYNSKEDHSRSQWPRGLRRRSAAARLLGLWVRIPLWAWTFDCCECCVLLGRGLCEELITRPEESYRLWCVVVCDLENLVNEEALAHRGEGVLLRLVKNIKET